MTLNILTRRGGYFSEENTLSRAQIETDALVSSFAEESTNVSNLLAMSAAGLVGQMGRTAFLASPLTRSLPSFAIRTLSGISALLSESTTLSAYHYISSDSHQASQSFTSLWKINLVQLASLRLFSGLSHRQNVFVNHSMTSFGMVAGNQASAWAGFTPTPSGSLAEQVVHAEITNLQFHFGSHLSRVLGGAKLELLNRSLELEAQSRLTTLNVRPALDSNLSLTNSSFMMSGDSLSGFSNDFTRGLRRRLSDSSLSVSDRKNMTDQYFKRLRALPSNHSETVEELFRALRHANNALATRSPGSEDLYPEVMRIFSDKMTEAGSGEFRIRLLQEGKNIYKQIHSQGVSDSAIIPHIAALPPYLRMLLSTSSSPEHMNHAYDFGMKIVDDYSQKMHDPHLPNFYPAATEAIVSTFEQLGPYFCENARYQLRLSEEINYFAGIIRVHRYGTIAPHFMRAFIRLAKLSDPSENLDNAIRASITRNTQYFSENPIPLVRAESLRVNIDLLGLLPADDTRTESLRIFLHHHYNEFLNPGEVQN